MGKVLVWSLAGTALFVIVEAVAGIRAHSLSLLSDAAHNFTDALALLLAWLAVYFGRKPADSVKTYGYHRAGVLAAFVNALSLLILACYILFESYQRWLRPQAVGEMTMLVVAAGGVLVNGGILQVNATAGSAAFGASTAPLIIGGITTAVAPAARRVRHQLALGARGKAPVPAKTAEPPSSRSMRSSRLYLATRSDRDGAPVLIWPPLMATTKSAMKVSSVSPLRWLTTGL